MQDQREYGAKLTQGQQGLSIFDDRLNTAHTIISSTMDMLYQIDNRLYSPRPSPVANTNPTDAAPSSIENNVNSLVNRLRELENLAGRLLHG